MQVIKHVNNHFDCFSGIGYETHTRIQLVRGYEVDHETKAPTGPAKTMVRYVSGQRLPQTVVKQLVEQLNPKLHYQNLPI